MTSKPNGIFTPAAPVTIPDPHSLNSNTRMAVEMAMRAEELRSGRVDYAPAATPKQLDQYRLELELDREARNRNVRRRR